MVSNWNSGDINFDIFCQQGVQIEICADNCDECRYPSRCKTCTLGYELLDDYTCSKCPEATYPLENACEGKRDFIM